MASIVTKQIFDFVLGPKEREAIEELIRSEGCKAKFKVLPEMRGEVKIEVEIEQEAKGK